MSLDHSDHVRYAQQLEAAAREFFAPGNIHVIIYDDLQADPEATLRGMLDFLGLPVGDTLAPRRTGASRSARSPRLHRFAGEVRMPAEAPPPQPGRRHGPGRECADSRADARRRC